MRYAGAPSRGYKFGCLPKGEGMKIDVQTMSFLNPRDFFLQKNFFIYIYIVFNDSLKIGIVYILIHYVHCSKRQYYKLIHI